MLAQAEAGAAQNAGGFLVMCDASATLQEAIVDLLGAFQLSFKRVDVALCVTRVALLLCVSQ